MHLVRNLDNYAGNADGMALTIGNFDGLHIGHRAVLGELKERAGKLGLKTGVMCFEPQPLEFLSCERIPARLSRFRDKYLGLKELSIDTLFCLKFNEKLAGLSPESFIKDILVKKLNVRLLIVGDDFRFGKKGGGGYELLSEAGKMFGFTVFSMSSYRYCGERVSSTAIRQLLSEGALEKVSEMLGEYFYIRGKVCHGRKIGSTISFPTANINLNRRVIPLFGIYAVKVGMPDGTVRYGMANVGIRPTVNGSDPLLEVFIFDFSGDLYTREIKVSFIKKLRDEIKFPSLTELKQQISRDEQETRAFFKAHP
ncbi:bifunctional riboflavin kinase/FAD synthetase [uncultured Ruminobacter sp.]|jgi:riboflavin kinase/FMN adenylyltransferase|uniref:bifunctional riboflavin kinase/FAD synthetase n=1 Tax=Ruminobacter sp. TaxID=2774296 RepID=UPI0025FF5F32|nr:bifunctional riboflavin kinase/FAD synthetase [uncultured Ruminobacter sp.]